MNPALRGGATLFICLLAVFPCGAGLTVLGTLAAETVRSFAGNGHAAPRWDTFWITLAWAGAGVVGFLSLIYGVDKLLLAQKRLPWYVLFGILLGIVAAGFFSLTYPLRTQSALFLRIVCVAPVAIEFLLFITHIVRYLRTPPAPVPVPTKIGAEVGQPVSPASDERGGGLS